jgi:hypothetical protein
VDIRRRLAEMAILITLAACVTGESVSPKEPPSTTSPASTYPLVATDEVLRQQCRAAANLLEFSVPCPTALPATNNPVRCAVPGAFRDANVTPKKGCALGGGFLLSPTGIQDLDLYHLLIEGGLNEPNDCGTEEPYEAVETVHGQGLLFACEVSGLHEGHTMVRLEIENVFVYISAHGHTEKNEQVALAIADTIQMVQPG